MTEPRDLDPQEAIEHDYDPYSDITTEEEADLPLDPVDDGYVPELGDDGDEFDENGWPGDELVIADLDEIDETDDEEDEDEK